MKNDGRERYTHLRQAGLLTTIPFLLLASPLVGYGLGWLLDRWLHTVFLTWVFLALGMVAGVREVVRILRKVQESENDSDES
jgi:F0F1-type ATP synthase assembly protein I